MTPEDKPLAAAGTPQRPCAPDSTIAKTAEQLRAFKATLDLAIRDYPTPIAGCDEQFNHLLEQRDRALRHLRGLDALCHEGAVPDDVIRQIANFIESSVYGKTPIDTADPLGH